MEALDDVLRLFGGNFNSSMKLFLCEKPSQAKDIAPHVGALSQGNGCITGNGVTVTWAIGHLVEQAKPEHYNPELKYWNLAHLPVIPERWHMEVKDKTRSQYAVVSRLIREATEIVIATDADREGEVIARELMQLNGYKGSVSRLWLSAFDDASVKKAVGKLLPGAKTLPMYYSGMGRSRADWLAGMNLTMALTKAFGTGGKDGTLHCGRVQTPVLALVVRRERAIANFVAKTHYQLGAGFRLTGVDVPMAWIPDQSVLDKDGHVANRAQAEDAAKRVVGKTGSVSLVETTPEREKSPLPYSLGALQREASARFGMKLQAVLDAAQALYEKHKATTYPRTDCEYLPASMIHEAPATLEAVAKAIPELQGFAKTAMQAVAGDFSGRAFNDKRITAHHAIIPTQNPNVDVRAMSAAVRAVYELICRRYLAQFLGDFNYQKMVIEVTCEGELFRVTGKTPLVAGWHALNPQQAGSETKTGDEKADPAEAVNLPKVSRNDPALNTRCEVQVRKTTPPKRYTEGTLQAAMESIDKEIEDPRWKAVMKNKEKAGIGTDATRSAIIEGLFKRDYIVARKKELVPTEKGVTLIGLIEEISPEIADPVLTAQWEDRLSQIEKGEIELAQFEQSLGEWLRQVIEGIKDQAGNRRMPTLQDPHSKDASVVECPSCEKPMRRIKGSKGFFWGCTGFKEGCKSTLPDVDGKPGEARKPATAKSADDVPYPCPQCQKPLRRVNGPKGPFWGCTGYPECRHTQPDDNGKPGVRTDDVAGKAERGAASAARSSATRTAKAGDACPDCKTGLLINKTMKDSGKPFVGCNSFPACRFFAWPKK
jgi:DNA topoisomerase-3